MLAAAALAAGCAAPPPVVVGSKKFTESVLIGELVALSLGEHGVPARHQRELGGTRVVFEALLRGDVDLYPEYTGTIRAELTPAARSDEEAAAALRARGIATSAPLGFGNAYALGMKRERAAALHVRSISDLAGHPTLRYGLSDEFLRRADGWPSLRERYGLGPDAVRGMDHELAYRGLAAGELDVVDLYSTDPEIQAEDLTVLIDDRHQFPRYDAVLLYRSDLRARVPAAAAAIARLEGKIDAAAMIAMNARARAGAASEQEIAAAFLHVASRGTPRLAARLWSRTREHLFLAGVSLALAIALAIPLGIVAARRPRAGRVIFALIGVVQTVPALALLVVMIPLLGIGAPPALAALFLYALLPIVRATSVGLRDLSPALIESATALGLPSLTRLRLVELPLASRAILGGVKTAAVISVGGATLGALVGAGGYGQPILSGIRLASTSLILEGAIPAAVLALAVEAFFGACERRLVPRGLRGG